MQIFSSTGVIKTNKVRFLFPIVLFIIVEMISRLYVSKNMDTSFLDPSQRLRASLQIRKILSLSVSDSSSYRVLVLSSSILLPTRNEFNNKLIKKINRLNVKIFNVSTPSKTALQNCYEYALFSKIHFDLVLLYQGANEFKRTWDHNIDFLILKHPESQIVVIPLAIHCFLLENLPWRFRKYIQPNSDVYSSYKKIVGLSQEKHETLIIPTLANNITEKNSWHTRTDENGHLVMATNYYNDPKLLSNKIKEFNTFILTLYSPYLIIIDANNSIPKDEAFFIDWCHFTNAGTELFIDNIIPNKGALFNLPVKLQPQK